MNAIPLSSNDGKAIRLFLPADRLTRGVWQVTLDSNSALANTITAGNNLLGLGSMIKRLKAHAPVFADCQ